MRGDFLTSVTELLEMSCAVATAPPSFVVPDAASLKEDVETPACPGPWLEQPGDSAADAHATFQFLTRVRCALRFHAPLLSPAHVACICGLLAREVSSLRSAIARNALCAAGELDAGSARAVAWDAALPLLDALVVKAVSDKRFIRDAARAALTAWSDGAPAVQLALFLLSFSGSRSSATALLSGQLADRWVSALGVHSRVQACVHSSHTHTPLLLLPLRVITSLSLAEVAVIDLGAAVPLLARFFSSRAAETRLLAARMLSRLDIARGRDGAVAAALDAVPAALRIEALDALVAVATVAECGVESDGDEGGDAACTAACGRGGRGPWSPASPVFKAGRVSTACSTASRRVSLRDAVRELRTGRRRARDEALGLESASASTTPVALASNLHPWRTAERRGVGAAPTSARKVPALVFEPARICLEHGI